MWLACRKTSLGGRVVRRRKSPLNIDSPVMRRVLDALARCGDLTTAEISMEACVGDNTLCGGGYLRFLVKEGRIHVASYRRNYSGAPSPVYRLGPGKPAKKPRPFTQAEKAARWRKRTGYRSKGTGFLVGVVLKSIASKRKTEE